MMLLVQVLPENFPPLERVQIQALACTPPTEYDLPITHWSVRELATVIVNQKIITTIHYSTVHLILQESELKPHRSNYWMTTQDPEFIPKAAKVLWCYEQADYLARKGELVVCIDEKPYIQALERLYPDLPMIPGVPCRREFHYKRHGTVSLLAALIVHTGEIKGYTLDKNDHEHFLDSMDRFVYTKPEIRKFHFILDNSSTISTTMCTNGNVIIMVVSV